MNDTILLCCRGCHGSLRYRHAADTSADTVWFCERCGWSCRNDPERLDCYAYGRTVNPAYGERNRFYPDQWGH